MINSIQYDVFLLCYRRRRRGSERHLMDLDVAVVVVPIIKFPVSIYSVPTQNIENAFGSAKVCKWIALYSGNDKSPSCRRRRFCLRSIRIQYVNWGSSKGNPGIGRPAAKCSY